jgi:hypothetical protein
VRSVRTDTGLENRVARERPGSTPTPSAVSATQQPCCIDHDEFDVHQPLMKAESQAGRRSEVTLGGLCVDPIDDQSVMDCVLDLDTPTLAEVESCRSKMKKRRAQFKSSGG